MKKYIKPLWPIYLTEFFLSFWFTIPIWVLFFQSRGLTPTDIGFVATGAYISQFLLEYPSGIFADKYGRKKSIIIAVFLSLLTTILELTAHSVTQFFIAYLCYGASFAFTSGAKEALIYDTLKSKKLEKYNAKVLGSLAVFASIPGIVSSFFGSILFTKGTTLPYIATIIACSLALISTFFIKEPKLITKEKQDIKKTFKLGIVTVFKNPLLYSLFIIYIPLFFFEEAWYLTQQPNLVSLGLPVALLGTFMVGKTFFWGIGGAIFPILPKKIKPKYLFLLMIILEAIIWLLLGKNSLAIVIASSYALLLIHELWNYVDADIIHKHIKSEIRATVLSARQMLINLVFIFNPWLMGYLTNHYDRTILFPVFGIVVLIVAIPIYLTRKKYLK